MRYILTSADSYFITEMTNAFGAPDVIVTEEHVNVSAKIRFSFHQCYAADYGHFQNYEACDDETMRALASCQVHYYRMADRFAINREFNFRSNSYYKHLGTWLHLLKGIDCVVFSNVPHEGYDWVLYNAAKTFRHQNLYVLHNADAPWLASYKIFANRCAFACEDSL